MQPLTGAAIRQAFVHFFQQELGHLHLPSASLVPANNPTVLLTPAGMLPFVPIFLGIEPPPTPPRAVTTQKCARVSGKASDLEAVGRTPRHHTFFEMLGNFSFGDYFKAQVIPWAWRFVTEKLGLPPERLWVSVFEGDTSTPADEEAFRIWRDVVGVPEERILRCGAKDNFWGPPGPTGPCGPCSEIHYQFDLTKSPHTHDIDECLLEIWNLVFMEFFKDAEGKLSPLEKKNVDTGMGLERVAAILQEAPNTFETDLLFPIVQAVAQASGVPYGQSADGDVALKIVTDHLRFLAFALADGVMPSNEGRGYVARMILRRAVRYGKRYLGFEQPFLHALLPEVAALYGNAYPEVRERLSHTQAVVEREEQRFYETLERGSAHLDDYIQHLAVTANKTLDGEQAFKLYDTYGFPVELTKDILAEHGLALDEDGFHAAMAKQKEQARSARKNKGVVDDEVFGAILQEVGPTRFIGYDTLEAPVTVLALVVDGERVSEVSGTNQPFTAIVDATPFYPESGGQVGDRGWLSADEGQQSNAVVVNDTQKLGDLILHSCVFDQGRPIRVGDQLVANVEPVTRFGSAIHHSATHLLHAALRKVLGEDAVQAGSYVGPDGARFDFSFPRPVSPDELTRIEALMNQWIRDGLNRQVQDLPLEEAKKAGAIAMFGEKYGQTVRVVRFANISLELCGGTHVDHLGQIGLAKITSESAIASGVRRIEFVVGEAAYRAFKQVDEALRVTAQALKVPASEVPDRVAKLQDDLRARDKTIAALQDKLAVVHADPILATLSQQAGAPYAVASYALKDVSADGMRTLAQTVADRYGQPLVLLLGAETPDGKAQLLCWVTDSLTKTPGIKAGDMIKQAAAICGGGGGGKPTLAQAGGKDATKLPEALAVVESVRPQPAAG